MKKTNKFEGTTRTIAFSGHMGSGKDTAAAIILEEVPGAKAYAFADHLKKIAIELFDCTDAEVYGDEKEKEFENPRVFDVLMAQRVFDWIASSGQVYSLECYVKSLDLIPDLTKPLIFKTSRALQQFIGTELLRDCYSKDYHITQVCTRIMAEKPSIAVVTDARFPNERVWARSFGATTALITGRNNSQLSTNNFNKHASETGLGSLVDYDYGVDNSGTVAQLRDQVMSIVDNL